MVLENLSPINTGSSIAGTSSVIKSTGLPSGLGSFVPSPMFSLPVNVVTGNTQPPPSAGGGIVNSQAMKVPVGANTTNIPTAGNVSVNVNQQAQDAEATGVTFVNQQAQSGKSSGNGLFVVIIVFLVALIFRKQLGIRN